MAQQLALAAITAGVQGSCLELAISSSDISAGDTISISGEVCLLGASVKHRLTGPNGDAHPGDVQTNDDGDFTQPVTIPGTFVPGHYLVRAQGDREASAALSVGVMAGVTEPTSAATAERDRSAAWEIIAVDVLLSFVGLGAVIARPRIRVAALQRTD